MASVGKAVSAQMVTSLKNNGALLELAASKVDSKAILNDASLSPDEKLEKLNKLLLTMAVEVDDLKTQVARGGAGAGPAGPSAPGGGDAAAGKDEGTCVTIHTHMRQCSNEHSDMITDHYYPPCCL